MFKYKLTLCYDGTSFGGWQIQSNATSIQFLLEKALALVLQAPTAVIGSGRTDAGVHALAQVAHFTSSTVLDPGKVRYTLNSLLPKEIRVLAVEEVAIEFHARYSATGKIYHYHWHLDPILNPFTKLYRWHIPYRISLPLIEKALPYIQGTHDFSSFAHEAHKGAASQDAVRTLRRLEMHLEEGGARIELEGDGFLYKMVRNIVGTLIEVGRGRLEPALIEKILQSKDRSQAGPTAPPQGLFLVQVQYY